MELTTLTTLAGLAVSVAGFFVGRFAANRSSGKQDGTILSELGYLKSNTDEIKSRLDRQDERLFAFVERLTAVESSSKQAHKRLDAYRRTEVAK